MPMHPCLASPHLSGLDLATPVTTAKCAALLCKSFPNPASGGGSSRPGFHLPDAVAGDDHEVVGLIDGQHLDVWQGRDHLLLWREILVALVKVIS